MECIYFYSPNLAFGILIEIFSAGCLLQNEVHRSQEKQIFSRVKGKLLAKFWHPFFAKISLC